jgi:hypothetical protein
MGIAEAVKKAIEENGLIARKSAVRPESTRYAMIKPTNSYETCYLIVSIDGKPEKSCRCWNPTADDLMADDWCVIKE